MLARTLAESDELLCKKYSKRVAALSPAAEKPVKQKQGEQQEGTELKRKRPKHHVEQVEQVEPDQQGFDLRDLTEDQVRKTTARPPDECRELVKARLRQNADRNRDHRDLVEIITQLKRMKSTL